MNIEHSNFNKVVNKAEKDRYKPPKDGQLTEDQIKMYVVVKKRESVLNKAKADKVKSKLDKSYKTQDGSILVVLLSRSSSVGQDTRYSLFIIINR